MSHGGLFHWERLVEDCRDATALIDPKGELIRVGEIDERSSALCQSWMLEGLRARRIVALDLSNGVDWLSGFIACLKLGAVAVPLDPGFSDTEVLELSKEIRVQGIWDGKRLLKGICPRPYSFRTDNIEVGKLTSGSTGKPKRLFFSGEEMVADAKNLIRGMGILPEDVNLGMIPWGHSYGLGSVVYPLLIQGTRTTWTDTPFPEEVAEVCRMASCTLFPSVPTVLRALGRSECSAEKFASLRLVVSAGARLDPMVARVFLDRFGKRVHNFYGSTETGGICFDDTGEAALTGRSVGKPLAGVDVIIARGNRIDVASDAVFGFDNPRRDARGKAMVRVADLGSLDERGELVLQSRAVNLIKIGARRINPVDIERRLMALEGVGDAKVFALDRDGDAVIAAALESELPRGRLGGLIREALPARLRPKRWLSYESFPVTARGKVSLASIMADFREAP